LPEIKTRQNQGKPVLSTAQQQMQRSFVKARQEQAAQKQNEQSESPNSYAEEKISRTAEDAVRDIRTLARESVRTIRQRSDLSASGDSGPTYDSSPAGSAAMEYSGNPAVRRQIAEASHRHGPVRQTATESPEPQSRVVQAPRPIRTREQQAAVSSAVEAPLSRTQQQAARKATAENIVKQKQEQKNALRSELAQNTGILESIPQETTPASSSDIKVVKSPPAQNLRNGGSAPEVPTSSVEVPIKKKASVPIRTRQSGVPIKTLERAATKATDPTTAQAFREAKKATVAAAQKNAHAAATAGRRAAIAAKKAAEIAAKLAKSAEEAAKALYAAIIAGGAASILVIVIVVLIGCGAAIFGSQDESTETLPLSAEVESYEPVIRKYAKQYGIPDYVLLIQAVMMQESGGRGNDPMQASECGYNTQYPRTPGGITDPEYSISVGIQNLADCLQTAGAESPIDLDHIQLALQGYNFGSGYISWALQKYGEYSRANAIEFSMKMAEQMGWNSYGDKQYVPHVLRYYPIGKVFYTPEDGDAIVDVALTQVGNVGGEPYWSWYGFTNHVEWCACFVSWCADQCGYLDSGAYPKFSGCVFGMQWFQQRSLWLDSSTEPAPGMLIFFDWATQDGVPDHVGIVEKVDSGMVYTVEGNSRDMCRQKQYTLGSGVILGYGMAASGS
jgi:hypothetical protein